MFQQFWGYITPPYSCGHYGTVWDVWKWLFIRCQRWWYMLANGVLLHTKCTALFALRAQSFFPLGVEEERTVRTEKSLLWLLSVFCDVCHHMSCFCEVLCTLGWKTPWEILAVHLGLPCGMCSYWHFLYLIDLPFGPPQAEFQASARPLVAGHSSQRAG